ncbi:hypothetical protein D9M72_429390 [compost metagenome]
MFIGCCTQIGTNALRYARQQVGPRPSQRPGHQRCSQQSGQVQAHQAVVDWHAVLERDQHLVHQRHGQVRRHQRGRSGQQRQQEARQQLPLVGPGKAPQAQQRPGRGRGFQLPAALKALLLVRGQRRLAGRAQHLARLAGRARAGGVALRFELVSQPQRGRIVTKRISPAGQPAFRTAQFQRAHARVVGVRQAQGGRDVPFPHIFFTRSPGNDALVGHNQPPLGKMQLRVEVQSQSGQDGLAGSEPRSGFSPPGLVGSRGGRDRQGGLGHGWRGVRPGGTDIT